ncbi:MAG: serine/threonine protein kinase, partial [Polyangiaceae bacterium]|nr:serine/threonine protein kinase [Polyangiaceae bacterium]
MPDPAYGPYRIARRIATGGMAEVFEAFRDGPHGFEKQVALKRILPQHSSDPDFVRMFVDEARIAARLQHPNIVQVFDFGETDGQLFLAMELVHGTTVSRLMRALAGRNETLSLELSVYVVWKVAAALEHAHRQLDSEGHPLGFVHRDVSPANILIGRHGHVKLTDFGIATVRVRAPTTEDGHVRGKVGYMSPEQVLGHNLTGRSDVFTLGIVLAELVMGEPLFAFGSDLDVLLRIRDLDLGVLHRSERPIAHDVKSLLLRMLARLPEERLSAAAVADECEKLLQRRGFTHGSDRLAALVGRVGLFGEEVEDPSVPGGERTSMLDPELLVSEEVDEVGQMRLTTRAEYRVRTVDGDIIGPISFPRLVELVTSGKVDGRTLIAKAEGAFGPACVLPELTRFVTSPALGWDPSEIEQAVRRGRLEGARLLPVFFSLVHGHETGVLHLWASGRGGEEVRRKKIYFVDGRPEFVASTDRRELLGEFLVARGYCLRMEVDMALALLPRYGGRLGDALVG